MRGSTVRLALAGLALAACGSDSMSPDGATTVAFDFANGAQGWTAGFADYTEDEIGLGLEAGIAPLPAPLSTSRTGFHIEGVNRSDDLFMYLTRRVDGVEAGARYRVTYEIELATDAPRGCIGVGGAPGESVYVKAGAAPAEPVTSTDASGHVRLNVDHGAQAQGGAHARTIGNVATTNTDCGHPVYELKTLRLTEPLEVMAAADGTLWLLVGTDSGFESRTSLYYTRIQATLAPAD